MVLQVAYTLASKILPSERYVHVGVSILGLVITYAFAQGRTTDRERDLHARTIIVTGAFTPLGLTLVSNLASRGAHIIAISPYPLSHPQPSLLIPALRTATNNPNIYADYADLSSPASIRDFCTRFLTGDDQRLDALLFAHEYQGIGSLFSSKESHEEKREVGSLATFLMATLLLPALLVAPVERDIRIVNVVDPFYAAATPSFTSHLVASMISSSSASSTHRSVFLHEGYRALRSIVFTRHLQRILNALPNRAPTLDPSLPGKDDTRPPHAAASTEASATTANPFPSNIIAISVCPGISRSQTISNLFGAEREGDPEGWSRFGTVLYFLFFPIIWLFSKGSNMAMQSILHVLFLPTPFKRALAQASAAVNPPSSEPSEKPEPSANASGKRTRVEDMFTEVLKPGALYRECSVAAISVAPLPEPPKQAQDAEKKAKADKKAGGEKVEEDLVIEDDGEYGGEAIGRVVWEWYELHLKTWEKAEKDKEEAEKDKEQVNKSKEHVAEEQEHRDKTDRSKPKSD